MEEIKLIRNLDINEVHIDGQIISPALSTHTTKDNKTFYEYKIKIDRTSGNSDILKLISEKGDLIEGAYYEVVGQLRSHNIQTENKSQLDLYVFAKNIISQDEVMNLEPFRNDVHLTGTICKAPSVRETPFHKVICDLLVAINRTFKKSDYIPSIAWGKIAKIASELKIGDKVDIIGRFQSREYRKVIDGIETIKTAYELSISNLEVIKPKEE